MAISLPSRRELTVLVPLTDRQVEWYKKLLCGLDSDIIETVMRESNISNIADIAVIANEISSGSGGNLITDITNFLPMEIENTESMSEKTKGNKKNKNDTKDNTIPSSSSSIIDNSTSEKGGGDSDWRKLLNLLLQLRKICNHIYLMPDAAPDPYDIGIHIFDMNLVFV